MLLRHALTFAVFFCTAAFADAAVVQVEFTAELESSSSGFDPVTSVSGYFRFDDSAVEDLSIFTGGEYANLLEFGIRSPDGFIVEQAGLITNRRIINSGPAVINGPGPGPIHYSYEIHVGTVIYPTPTAGQGNIIVAGAESVRLVYGENGEVIGIAFDFEDYQLFDFDFPYVPSPILALELNLEEEEVLFDGSHAAPILSQSRDSNLKFNYQGQTASYLITSLQIVPEPTSLLLLSIASTFWVMSRRRV